jgi:hypothetical protein
MQTDLAYNRKWDLHVKTRPSYLARTEFMSTQITWMSTHITCSSTHIACLSTRFTIPHVNVLATKTHPAVFWLTNLSSQSFISKLTVSCKIYNTHNHQGYVKPHLQVEGKGRQDARPPTYPLPPYTVPRTLEPASQDLASNTSSQEEYYCVRYLQE